MSEVPLRGPMVDLGGGCLRMSVIPLVGGGGNYSLRV